MYLELVDVLRCTADHEESPLVAAITRRDDRDIVDGVLGCAVCHAEYPIERGIAVFGDGTGAGAGAAGAPDRDAEPPEALAMRCAAMLGLHEPGGIVVLGGTWGGAARELAEMTRVLAMLIEPPPEVPLANGIGAIRTGGSLPLAAVSVRGIALDERTATPSLVASAVPALGAHGRLVAPVAVPMPPGVVELARDDRYWVAEARAVASPPIQLIRSRDSGR